MYAILLGNKKAARNVEVTVTLMNMQGASLNVRKETEYFDVHISSFNSTSDRDL